MSNLAIGASYSSNTLNVGDGSWDTDRNTYLLPPLVGINFATMRLNGMGNRFKDFANYHQIILAHGVLAAITFLFVVPAAIMFARFYGSRPFWALRLHIWLQIWTVILTTIVFILGNIAVGPLRRYSNPHHGIGLAIFILVLLQFLGGALVYHREKKAKSRTHIPFRLMVHQWTGRMIALLGIAQVPLGLYLYGSPKYLFVLYSLVAAALLFTYMILAYHRIRRLAREGHRYTESFSSGSESHHGHGLGGVAAAGAAGLGLAALANRHHSRRGSGSRSSVHEGEHLTGHSEKPHKSGLGKKLLEGGAIIGALALAKNLFSRNKKASPSARSSYSGSFVSDHRPGVHSRGRAAPSGTEDSGSYSYASASRPRSRSGSRSRSRSRGGGGVRKLEEGAAAVGIFGLAKRFFSGRNKPAPDARSARRSSRGNLTGDGRNRNSFVPGPEVLNTPPRTRAGVPGVGPSLAAADAAMAAGALAPGPRSELNATNTYIPPPPPPLGYAGPGPMAVRGVGGVDDYASTSTPTHEHDRSHLGEAAALGGAAGLAGGALASHSRTRSRDRSRSERERLAEAATASPPGRAPGPPARLPLDDSRPPLATISVKPHRSGRNITLRHLPDAEAEARMRPSGPRGARATSTSSTGDSSGHWRRVDDTLSPSNVTREDLRPGPSVLTATAGPSQVEQQPSRATVSSPLTAPPSGATSANDAEDRRRRRRMERARNASGGGGGLAGREPDFN